MTCKKMLARPVFHLRFESNAGTRYQISSPRKLRGLFLVCNGTPTGETPVLPNASIITLLCAIGH